MITGTLRPFAIVCSDIASAGEWIAVKTSILVHAARIAIVIFIVSSTYPPWGRWSGSRHKGVVYELGCFAKAILSFRLISYFKLTHDPRLTG
jgi:hypothetical protein